MLSASSAFTVFLFTTLSLFLGHTCAQLRGLNPELRDYYDLSKETFVCLDGLKTFPVSYVNDDYCDCFDGSDEPGLSKLLQVLLFSFLQVLTYAVYVSGTSACSKFGGKFYCRNRGHQPLLLNSSFVDDGICGKVHLCLACMCISILVWLIQSAVCILADCCDGSDENSGKCKNTCLEEGAAASEALRSRAVAFKAGWQIQQQHVKEAALLKAAWQTELESADKQLAERKRELETTKAALADGEPSLKLSNNPFGD